MDPPQHRFYRNLITSAFTPRTIERLRGRVAEITQELLGDVRPARPIDFVTALAYPSAHDRDCRTVRGANR